jgi:hypothetical protein
MRALCGQTCHAGISFPKHLRFLFYTFRSAHIPAIVVSQPSVDTEDDEPEATDTDRYIWCVLLVMDGILQKMARTFSNRSTCSTEPSAELSCRSMVGTKLADWCLLQLIKRFCQIFCYRLIIKDEKDSTEKTTDEPSQAKSAPTTYSWYVQNE